MQLITEILKFHLWNVAYLGDMKDGLVQGLRHYVSRLRHSTIRHRRRLDNELYLQSLTVSVESVTELEDLLHKEHFFDTTTPSSSRN